MIKMKWLNKFKNYSFNSNIKAKSCILHQLQIKEIYINWIKHSGYKIFYKIKNNK